MLAEKRVQANTRFAAPRNGYVGVSGEHLFASLFCGCFAQLANKAPG